MRYIICLFTLFINGFLLHGQMNSDYATMLQEAEHMLFLEPNESIKIATHIVQNSEDSNQSIRASLILYTAYCIKGDYNSAVNYIFRAKSRAESSDNVSMQIQIAACSVPLLYYLGLDVVAHEYFSNLNLLTENISIHDKAWLTAGNTTIKAFDDMEKRRYNSAMIHFTAVKMQLQSLNDKLLLPIIEMIGYDLNYNALQSSRDAIYQTLDKNPTRLLNQMVLEQLMGKFNFLSKNYANSISHYELGLRIANKFDNDFYRAQIEDGLAKSYLANDNKLQFQLHKKAAITLNKAVELKEKQTVNAIFNFINSNQSKHQQDIRTTYQNNVRLLAGLIVLIALSYFTLKMRYRSRIKQYEGFISYFEKRNQLEVHPKKDLSKGSSIPKDTEEFLIKRLNQFEHSKQFTKKDMSLAQLASSFDTNTKYLSEVINTYKGKNFNAYINELRINYIIDKLQNDRRYRQYKISYLAEECGFSSHSSFGSVFKVVTGISPTVFMEILDDHNKFEKKSKKVYENIA